MSFEGPPLLEYSALDQNFRLGDQIDAYKYQYQQRKGSIIKKVTGGDVDTEDLDRPVVMEIVDDDSISAKAQACDIDWDVLAHLLAKHIDSSNQKSSTRIQPFVLDSPPEKQTVQAHLVYFEYTKKNVLKDIERFKGLLEERQQALQATHIVGGIEWGIFWALTLVAEVELDEDTNFEKERKAKKDELLEYLKLIKDSLSSKEAQVVIMNKQKKARFHAKIYASEVTEEELSTDEIIHQLRDETDRQRDLNSGRGVKLRYILWPMHTLAQISDNIRLEDFPWAPLPEEFVGLVIDQREQLNNKLFHLRGICQFVSEYKDYLSNAVVQETNRVDLTCKQMQNDLLKLYQNYIVAAKRDEVENAETLFNYIESNFSIMMQELNEFLSGDEDAFLEKINYIHYLEASNVVYVGKKENFLDIIKKEKECYVFFCSWDEIREDENGEISYMDKLISEQKPCYLVDQDLMKDPVFPNQCRICIYRHGKRHISDLLYRYTTKQKICLARPARGKFTECVKPKEAVQLEICCPRSSKEFEELACQETLHFWYCDECNQCFWCLDMYLYCSCGKAQATKFEFCCNDPAHGEDYVKFHQPTLVTILNSLPKMKDIHILVMGHTGVGKSTWLNSFQNYLTFSSLDEARRSENVCLIPSEFKIFTKDASRTVEQTIQVGERSANEVFSEKGDSATQFPKNYVFTTRRYRLHVIDTPGIGDTRGPTQDIENFRTIIRYLENYTELHGICILLKPNESRLNLMFRYCLNELLAHLHKDAAKNIMFCFTHAKGTNYKPADTLGVLKGYLKDMFSEDKRMDGVKIELNDRTVYCMDNESIRLVYAEHAGVVYDEEEIEGCRKSFNVSQKATYRLLEHVDSLMPHKMKDMLSVNDSRRAIHILSEPLVTISDLIDKSVTELESKQEELEKLENLQDMDEIQEKLFTVQYYIETKELDHPRTVCASPKCVIKPKNCLADQPFYTQICHDNCPLTGIMVNQTNVPQLKNCETFIDDDGSKKDRCRKCGCNYASHMHVTFEQRMGVEYKKVESYEDDPQEAARAFIVECKKHIAELKDEKRIITKAGRKFINFLKVYAIMASNGAFREYLEQEIRTLECCAPGARDEKKLMECGKLLAELKEQELILAQKTESKNVVDQEEIQAILCGLFGLKHTGSNIKAIYDRAIDEQAQHFAFSENKVAAPEIDALALEAARTNSHLLDTVFGRLAPAPEAVDPKKIKEEPEKVEQKEKNAGVFSYILGRVGAAAAQVRGWFRLGDGNNQSMGYPDTAMFGGQPDFAYPNRRFSVDTMSVYSNHSTSSISNSISLGSSSNPSKTKCVTFASETKTDFGTPPPKPTQKTKDKRYVPMHAEKTMDQLKGVINQKVTANSGNLPKSSKNVGANPQTKTPTGYAGYKAKKMEKDEERPAQTRYIPRGRKVPKT